MLGYGVYKFDFIILHLRHYVNEFAEAKFVSHF